MSKSKIYTLRTWRVTKAQAETIAALSRDTKIPANDLIRFLLAAALEQIEDGRMTLPIVPAASNRLDWEKFGLNITRWHAK